MNYENARRVRVCHLTSVHSVFDVRIFYKECKSLAKAGFDVTFIAPASLTDTKMACQDGVKIVTVFKPRLRWKRFTKTLLQVYRESKRVDADIYHFHDPELIVLGLLLLFHGKQVIYDVHEDLPNQITGKYWIPNWIKPGLRRLVGMIEEIGSRFLTSIVAATPTIAARFPNDRTVIIHNFPIVNELIDVEGSIPYQERPFYITYVGAISHLRGAKEMISAVQYLLEDYPSLTLNLVGLCHPESIKSELEMITLNGTVILWGQQDRSFVRKILGQARVGLVTLHPTQSYLDSYPVKLFEYMAVGIPVVASDFPLWREIVEGIGCGILVDPLNPQEIARGIEYLLTHPQEAFEMGERGRMAVEQKYNWEAEAGKLQALYQKLSMNSGS